TLLLLRLGISMTDMVEPDLDVRNSKERFLAIFPEHSGTGEILTSIAYTNPQRTSSELSWLWTQLQALTKEAMSMGLSLSDLPVIETDTPEVMYWRTPV